MGPLGRWLNRIWSPIRDFRRHRKPFIIFRYLGASPLKSRTKETTLFQGSQRGGGHDLTEMKQCFIYALVCLKLCGCRDVRFITVGFKTEVSLTRTQHEQPNQDSHSETIP